jgi:hypothetical protein
MEYRDGHGTGSAFADAQLSDWASARQQLRSTIVNGEFVADTWGDGIDKLPCFPVRERSNFAPRCWRLTTDEAELSSCGFNLLKDTHRN